MIKQLILLWQEPYKDCLATKLKHRFVNDLGRLQAPTLMPCRLQISPNRGCVNSEKDAAHFIYVVLTVYPGIHVQSLHEGTQKR